MPMFMQYDSVGNRHDSVKDGTSNTLMVAEQVPNIINSQENAQAVRASLNSALKIFPTTRASDRAPTTIFLASP